MSSAAGAISVTEPPRRVTMEAMESSMLTIAEAAQKTGRSASTIRRYIKEVVTKGDHADRDSIEPAPKAVEVFKRKGENFTWRIRENLLVRNFHRALEEGKKTGPPLADGMKEDVLQILQKELALKNKQIEKQWEVISALNERLREGNILMGSLQQRLALPKGHHSPPPVSVEASMEAIHGFDSAHHASPPSHSMLRRASKKNVMEVKQKISVKKNIAREKKGVLSWLFG